MENIEKHTFLGLKSLIGNTPLLAAILRNVQRMSPWILKKREQSFQFAVDE